MAEQLRPCIVDGMKAMYHQILVYKDSPVVIVELENGTFYRARLTDVRFIDGSGFDAVKWPNSAER